MYFRRKAYDQLLEWKQSYAGSYCALLEGARRVGKSTIAEQFASREYGSYVLIDFSRAGRSVLECFDDVSDLDMFFLRLQAATGKTLIRGDALVVFDEVQLFPKARQAVKHLVADGRYHYMETGSLISIKRNVRDILIPSEEKKYQIHPMDYEEFCWAAGSNAAEMSLAACKAGRPVGQQVNRKLLRDFRAYMAVGGMPQAVEAYVEGKSFAQIDTVKREIIGLYEDDFCKLDPSGLVSSMYHSIPAQLARNTRRYSISTATGKRRGVKAESLLAELIDSKTVLRACNSTDPRVSLSATKDPSSYKLYLADTGLFVTLMFIDRPEADNVLYEKLLSDKLPANLGYLYENAVAQAIASQGCELFYHTWDKEGSTHYYEIDFLVSQGAKVNALEVKSSGVGKHESLSAFAAKYSAHVAGTWLLSQKDFGKDGALRFVPIYACAGGFGSRSPKD